MLPKDACSSFGNVLFDIDEMPLCGGRVHDNTYNRPRLMMVCSSIGATIPRQSSHGHIAEPQHVRSLCKPVTMSRFFFGGVQGQGPEFAIDRLEKPVSAEWNAIGGRK